jgi:hypothetical protein
MGGAHIGGMSLVVIYCYQYGLAISLAYHRVEEGVFYLLKLSLPAFAAVTGGRGGGGEHPVGGGQWECRKLQNNQTGTVSNQLTTLEGESMCGGLVNLLMCDRGGTLYSHTPQSTRVST